MGPADPTGVQSFVTSSATGVTIVSDYLPGGNGWSGMDGAGGSISWLTDAWKSTGYTLSLGVPMIPTDSSGQLQGSLALGATGSYNGYFTTLATTLVSAGDANAYLRLGWEFDGNWYPWHAQTPTDESNYAAYFRQIVTAMRAVPGAAFRFVWNPDASAFVSKTYSVALAYPGDAYVDVIGLDLYDMNYGGPETPQQAWSNNYLPQLSAASSFAQSHAKPLALCEWGVVSTASHGLGDDPLYINDMTSWMKSPGNDVLYESYFNSNTRASDGGVNFNLIGGGFPNSLAAFTADLG